MIQPGTTIRLSDLKKWPFVALVITTLISLGVSFYFLQMGISIVFQNLFYFPILISCTYYQRKGLIFSVVLSFIYFFLVIYYSHDPMVLFQALVRVFIFILIAAVITILSQMNKESQEKLQKKEALFRGVFDTMPSGSAIYGVTGTGESDADYHIEDINSTALGYEQREKSEVIGRTLAEVHTVIHESNLVPRLLEAQQSIRPVSYQAEVKSRDETPGYYDTSLFRLLTGEVVSIYTDVTDKRLMEEDLKASEEKFRLAMGATSDGLWDWNMLTGEVYFSPAFARILDEDHIEPVYESWESRLHPADKERTLASLKEHISGKTSPWRVETRLKRSDGSWKWVMDRGSVVAWDETGKPARMIGSIVDISEQKRIEEVIRIERDRAEQYLNIAEVMIVALSRDGTVVLINRKGAEMLGWSVDDIIGLDWFDSFVPPDLRESVRETFISLMDGADEMYSSSENEIITCGGKRILISWVNTIIKTPAGQIIGTLSSGEDLTMRKELEKEKTSLLDQIQQNLAQIAYLNDNIRNPLTIIMTLSEIHFDGEAGKKIQEQIEIIDESITKLDTRWSESEKVLDFIRKHYQITPK